MDPMSHPLLQPCSNVAARWHLRGSLRTPAHPRVSLPREQDEACRLVWPVRLSPEAHAPCSSLYLLHDTCEENMRDRKVSSEAAPFSVALATSCFV